MRALLEPRIQGHADADGKSMSQAPRRRFYAGYLAVLRMPAQDPIGLAELPQLRFRKKSLVGEHGVQRQAAVAFAQNAPVTAFPSRIAGIVLENVVIQHAEDLDQRE